MKRKKVSLSQDAVSINFLLIFKFRFGIKGLKYHHSVTLSFFFCICISGANGERFPKNDITFSHVRACERNNFSFLALLKTLGSESNFYNNKKNSLWNSDVCRWVNCVILFLLSLRSQIFSVLSSLLRIVIVMVL